MSDENPGVAVTNDAAVEAILFVAGASVEVRRIVEITGLGTDAVQAALDRIAERHRGWGIQVQRDAEAASLVSAPRTADIVARFLGMATTGRLSSSALETLAIIAYRQPVTRAEIESIRGVNPEHALGTLLARSLIAEIGRRETVGRPATFGTTFAFLQHFGFASLDDLPELPRDLVEPTGSPTP
ncbi:MAG: SMC-Scp complex subunit ScpB [Chloroflexi bacterium]|nr:SMC-Scp complex subunit ScpB [Chloroflexota bacterium]